MFLASTLAVALAPETADAQSCAPPASGSGYQKVPLVNSLEQPMSFQEDPVSGRIFILQKEGALLVFDPLDTSIETIDTLSVVTDAELGLLGIALDPSFASNGHVFLYYTKNVSGVPTGTLSRFTITDSPAWSLDDEHVLLSIPHIVNYHDAGDLKFGPDGNLYLSTGSNDFYFGELYNGCDYQHDTSDCARMTSSEKNDLRGKILRITPTPAGGYTIPSGNMFSPSGTQKGEFLSMGHRNPFRISIDPVIPSGATIPTLYVAEVGTRYEEVNRVTGTGYYGWPIYEGPCAAPFWGPVAGLPTDLDPWLWYHQNADGSCQAAQTSSVPMPNLFDPGISGGKSAMAGPVYHYSAAVTNPRKLPVGLNNDLLFWDFSKGLVYNINITAGGAVSSVERFASDIDFGESNVVDMELGRDHALYILEMAEGQLSRIDYAPPGTNAAPVAFARATPQAGSAPLAVTLSACATPDACTYDPDPGQTATLTYSWDFEGDGVVDATGLSVTHTYPAGSYNAVLRVTDTASATTTAGVRVTSGNQPSTITVSSPVDGGIFNWGDTLALSASVTDPEDGATPVTIPCSDVEITSYLGHDTHKHNIQDVWACTDALTLADESDHDAALYYFAFRVQYVDNPVGAVPSVKTSSTINVYPKRTQAELAELSSGLRVASSAAPYVGGGKVVTDIVDGSYALLRGRNLSGITGVRYVVASGSSGGTIEMRRDSAAGPLVATTSVTSTGGFETFKLVETAFAPPAGKHDYYFVFRGISGGDPDLFDLDSIELDGPGVSTDNVPPTLLTAYSDRDPNKIVATFTEPVDLAQAQNLANYTFPLTLTGATLLPDRQTVILSTSGNLAVGTTYTLTASNIQDDAGNTIALGSSKTFTHRGFDVSGGVSALWQLDEAAGTTAADASGNAYTGTLTNGPTHTAGILGNAVTFDGIDDYVTIPALTYNGDFSVAAWVRLTRAQPNEDDAIVGQIGTGQDINFYAQKLRFFAPNDVVVAATPIQPNTWTHCAIVREGGVIRAYMSGREDGVGQYGGAFIPKALGHGNGGFLQGSLDDVRFYSRALTATEVAKLSDPTATGMAAHFDLDDGHGTTARDTSFANVNGTLVGGPTWEPGIRGGALAFDGANDAVTFSQIPLSDFTIAGFVKPEGLIDNTDALVGLNGFGSDINFYSGYPRFYSSSLGDIVTAAHPLVPNVWTHVAFTRQAGQLRIYLDGTLDVVGATTYTTTFSPRSIGRGNAGYFGGLMDDVRIYKRALSATEIDALATAKTPGLVAHWTLDDGLGSTAADASYNGNDAAVTAAGWTALGGQNRGALFLNGTTTWANPTDIQLGTGDFTVASWVNLTGTIDNNDAIVGQVGAGSDINFWQARPRLYTGTDIAVATQTVPANTWAHVAFTRKSGRVNLYRDGAKDTAAGATGCFTGSLPIAAIGRGNQGFLGGYLDDVRVYNAALRATDIKHLGDDIQQKLALFYTFNDGTASDASGWGYSGVLMNGPVGALGQVGGGLQLDGVNDWVNNPDIALPSDFTITFWLNLDPTINNQDSPVGQEGAGADLNFYGGFLRLYTGSSDAVVSNTGATTGTWQHWTITRSGGALTIYLGTSPVGFGSWAGTFNIKAVGRGNAGYLGGRLDDLRIYSRALSASEI